MITWDDILLEEKESNKFWYNTQLESDEWKKFRIPILNRDNNRCVICGKTHWLQVHHDCYMSGRNIWEVPESFVRTLCKCCHDDWHRYNKYEVKKPHEIDLSCVFVFDNYYTTIAKYAEGYIKLKKGQAREIGQFTKSLCNYNKIDIKKGYGGNKYPVCVLNFVFDNNDDIYTNQKLFGKYKSKEPKFRDGSWLDFRNWFYDNYNEGEYNCRFDGNVEYYHQYEYPRSVEKFISEITYSSDDKLVFGKGEYEELMRIIQEYIDWC